MIEPAVIGKGMSGTVYYPALSCSSASDFNSTGMVSKLTTRENADREIKLAVEVKRAIPNHAIYAEHVCESKIVDRAKNVLVFSKYGGDALVHLFVELEEYAYAAELSPDEIKQVRKKLPAYRRVLAAVRELGDHVAEMNRRSFFHNDVSTDNIVYSTATNRAYLIDFEKAGPEHREGGISAHMPPMPTDAEEMVRMVADFAKMIAKIEKLAGVTDDQTRRATRSKRKKSRATRSKRKKSRATRSKRGK